MDGTSTINQIKAVIAFGKPASPFLCKGICGAKYSKNVYELNRLVRDETLQYPLSQFVSAVLRRVRVKRWIIVSFSDMAMNHHGYIYQACNFIYTGCTKQRTDIYPGEGGHPRHYTDEAKSSGIRVVRSPKHRYVYFATYIRQEKREWKDALRYPILPYPKGDNNPDYRLGDYLKPTIITHRTGEHP